MVEKQTKIINALGLHLRAAALLAQTANRFKCDIGIKKNNKVINAKNILSLMSLEANKDTPITLFCKGEDQEEAIQVLIEMIDNKFGEPN